MERGLAILKIGGSVITEKDKPLTPRAAGIQSVAEAISEFGKPLVLVHGAGSFGHFIAAKHGLSQRPSTATPEAVSEVRASILKLNKMVVETVQSKGVNVYLLQPLALYDSKRTQEGWKPFLMNLIRLGVSPMSFGDVIPTTEGFRAVSGDEIVRDLAMMLRPERVVFSTDVDGLYRNYGTDERPIREISVKEAKTLAFEPPKMDVTGGIKGKLGEAIRIASMGIDVYFTNGLKKESLMEALKGEDREGTLIRGKLVA